GVIDSYRGAMRLLPHNEAYESSMECLSKALEEVEAERIAWADELEATSRQIIRIIGSTGTECNNVDNAICDIAAEKRKFLEHTRSALSGLAERGKAMRENVAQYQEIAKKGWFPSPSIQQQ
ncbi:hypothetical protein K4F52_010273, partial [Lecanicillium sp. MT-2017a]